MESGVALKVIGERLGHSTIKTTAKFYVRRATKVDREDTNLLAQA